ncbi:MAG: ADP-ribosylglycohydrolase family protein, partial [Anaerolineae bacterium]|nr:ADP-ribosylglycohydrolase family protein [Anaerolineae bacterium]
SAGNGSVMRCWPVAVAYWNDKPALLETSRLQSRVTHPHIECQEGSAFINLVIANLFQGMEPAEAVKASITDVDLPSPLQMVIETAYLQARNDLQNTGWVRHTLQSAIWGLLTTDSFEDAVVNVVNLGHDADTAGAVMGALAGAAYGLSGIPQRWQSKVWGEWPLGSGQRWELNDLLSLADRLSGI